MYDLQEIRESLTDNDIFDLLLEWNGDPQYTNFGIIANTIDHNLPQDIKSNHKMTYYSNSHMFVSWTSGDDPFDIFELCRKVYSIQKHQEISLPAAIQLIAFRFGFTELQTQEAQEELPDWELLKKYDRIADIQPKAQKVTLKSYDSNILKVFNYSVKLTPWLNEGIAQDTLDYYHIGYFPGEMQITIPHYDVNNRLIGVRGRSLSEEDCELHGKYRPLLVNKTMYNHPLGMNLYGLNKVKGNIKRTHRAIIMEGEKSGLKGDTMLGRDNNIIVACCGSNVSNYQMRLLLDLGVDEVVIALDRQFQKIGDPEFKKLTKNLTNLNKKYGAYVRMSFMFDKNMITPYKAAPIDVDKETFFKLYNERIYL